MQCTPAITEVITPWVCLRVFVCEIMTFACCVCSTHTQVCLAGRVETAPIPRELRTHSLSAGRSTGSLGTFRCCVWLGNADCLLLFNLWRAGSGPWNEPWRALERRGSLRAKMSRFAERWTETGRGDRDSERSQRQREVDRDRRDDRDRERESSYSNNF